MGLRSRRRMALIGCPAIECPRCHCSTTPVFIDTRAKITTVYCHGLELLGYCNICLGGINRRSIQAILIMMVPVTVEDLAERIKTRPLYKQRRLAPSDISMVAMPVTPTHVRDRDTTVEDLAYMDRIETRHRKQRRLERLADISMVAMPGTPTQVRGLEID
jgi:hypothetical protein